MNNVIILTDEDIQNLVTFMNRVDLKGAESTTHAVLLKKVKSPFPVDEFVTGNKSISDMLGIEYIQNGKTKEKQNV